MSQAKNVPHHLMIHVEYMEPVDNPYRRHRTREHAALSMCCSVELVSHSMIRKNMKSDRCFAYILSNSMSSLEKSLLGWELVVFAKRNSILDKEFGWGCWSVNFPNPVKCRRETLNSIQASFHAVGEYYTLDVLVVNGAFLLHICNPPPKLMQSANDMLLGLERWVTNVASKLVSSTW